MPDRSAEALRHPKAGARAIPKARTKPRQKPNHRGKSQNHRGRGNPKGKSNPESNGKAQGKTKPKNWPLKAQRALRQDGLLGAGDAGNGLQIFGDLYFVPTLQ
jgi:hypothetical protein